MVQFSFHWADYLVFCIMLAASTTIGLYHACRKSRNPALSNVLSLNATTETAETVTTTEDSSTEPTRTLLLGGGQLSVFPVTMSILATFMSAISLLGTVAEVYKSGAQYVLIGLAYCVAYPVTAEVFLPVFYHLKLVSIHQYLQLRFSDVMCKLVSIVYLCQMIFYISIVLYAPALAFSQVSGLPLWVSILSTGVVCTIYTALGGLRAVVWTDVMQMLLVIVAFCAVVIHCIIVSGGPSEVLRLAYASGRLNIIDLDPNPLVRHTLWTLSIGGSFMVLAIFATNQTSQQRYLACKSLKTAKLAIWLNLPLTFVFMFMLVTGGIVCFTVLHTCDPVANHQVQRYDQILPHTVMKLWHNIPALPGIFLSCIFAACLSTVSSGLNSISTVIVHDFFSSVCSCARGSAVIRLIGCVMGAITVLLAFLAQFAPQTILQIALSIFGVLGGPILAAFCQGLFMPCVNSQGAICGLLLSVCVCMWIAIGGIVTALPTPALPLSTAGCNSSSVVNDTMIGMLTSSLGNNNNMTLSHPHSVPTTSLYQLSYLYYTPLSILTSTSLALIISALTGFNSQNLRSARYFYPPIVRLGNAWLKTWPAQVLEDENGALTAMIESPEGKLTLHEKESL